MSLSRTTRRGALGCRWALSVGHTARCQSRHITSAGNTAPSEGPADDSPAAVFKRLVRARSSVRGFQAGKDIPEQTIQEMLAATMPYTIVMVRSRAAREQLASCMLGPNKTRVLEAPVTAVFAADLEPGKLVPRVVALERQRGAPEGYLATLPFSVSFMAGEGRLAHAFKDLMTTAISPLQPMPSVNATEAWSFKNTAFAASWYMLAATAHGLDTCPMEGFDGRRIRHVLRIPDRYSIPLVVATGYAKRAASPPKASPRFPASAVIFRDSYGSAYDGVPLL